MTDPKTKRWRKVAALAGVLLALVCHALPPEYQAACTTIATLCRGGF